MLNLLKNLGASWEQSRDGLYSDLEQIETVLNRRWAATFGTGTVFTKGSVVFAGNNGTYSQNNSNFFWDTTNLRLGLGTATPTTLLEVNGTTTIKILPGSASVRGLQVLKTKASSLYTGLERAIFVPATDGNENYGFTVNSIGTIYTGAAIVVSGTIDSNGFPEEASNVGGVVPYEPAMISIVPDIVGPAINAYPAQVGSWFFSALERTTGHHIFNIEANGSLTWGAGARGAEDTTLARTAAGKLTITNSLVISNQLTVGSLTIGRVPFASTSGLLADSANLFWDATNSRLGLGTTSPVRTLHVMSDSGSTFNSYFTTHDWDNTTTGTALAFVWGAASGSTYTNIQALNGGGSTSGKLILNLLGGNVGIGLNNPQGIFHVFGGTANFDCQDSFFGDRFGATGSYLDIGTLSTADTWLDARGSNADVSMSFRSKGVGSFTFKSSVADLVTILSSGRVGIGQAGPTALLHFKAGTATASTAPLKFTAGTNLTTAEAGAMEYDGTDLFFTRAGTVRENVLVAIDNVSAPTTAAGTPTTRYGGDTKYLGDPNRWLSVNILGTTYKIPLFT